MWGVLPFQSLLITKVNRSWASNVPIFRHRHADVKLHQMRFYCVWNVPPYHIKQGIRATNIFSHFHGEKRCVRNIGAKSAKIESTHSSIGVMIAAPSFTLPAYSAKIYIWNLVNVSNYTARRLKFLPKGIFLGQFAIIVGSLVKAKYSQQKTAQRVHVIVLFALFLSCCCINNC